MAQTVSAGDLDACLPQTQCGRCGYPRCVDYAEAMASHKVNIDRCPPGGEETIEALAQQLGTATVKLASDLGQHQPPKLARVRESDCIGCTLCIQACPVDAIIGASKLMHSVITEECTGCELCVAPCPMDCIELYPDPRPVADDSRWRWFDPLRVSRARDRSQANRRRDALRKKKTIRAGMPDADEQQQMRDEILAAVERVRDKRREREQKRQGAGRGELPVTVKPS